MNSRSIELLHKMDYRGVDVRGAFSDSDICHMMRANRRRARTKKCRRRPGLWILFTTAHRVRQACSNGRLGLR